MLDKLFGSENQSFETQKFRFYAIKGQERWVKVRQYGYPWHLETWATTTLRSRVIKRVLILLSYIDIHPYSICRDINIYQDSIYSKISLKFHSLGIFLGSPGPNRKIVIYGIREHQGYFIKVPISSESSKLLANEISALNFLSDHILTEDLIPEYELYEDLLVTCDARSNRGVRLIEIRDVYHVYERLYSVSSRKTALSTLLSKNFSEHFLIKLKNNEVSNKSVRRLANEIIKVCNVSLESKTIISVYKAHGDLTDWNMFIDNSDHPKIIDLEMFGEQPEFFDLIHYFCSYEILVKNSSKDQIFENLKLSLNDYIPATQFETSLLLYIIRQSIIYCEVFDQQVDLHPQALWQLESWHYLLNKLADVLLNKE